MSSVLCKKKEIQAHEINQIQFWFQTLSPHYNIKYSVWHAFSKIDHQHNHNNICILTATLVYTQIVTYRQQFVPSNFFLVCWFVVTLTWDWQQQYVRCKISAPCSKKIDHLAKLKFLNFNLDQGVFLHTEFRFDIHFWHVNPVSTFYLLYYIYMLLIFATNFNSWQEGEILPNLDIKFMYFCDTHRCYVSTKITILIHGNK